MTNNSTIKTNYTFSITVLTSLFFMWGFMTCLNDILIPHLKALFDLNYTETMLIQFCFFSAYFIVSLPAGSIVKKLGYRKGIIIGLLTAGIGCLLFYPSAGLRSYPLFLTAFFILAAGITLLQVAANPYVSLLGTPQTASSRLNLVQAFNSLGTTVAPYFGALLILSGQVLSADNLKLLSPEKLELYRTTQASSVQFPYILISLTLILIAIVFAIIKLPDIKTSEVKSADIDPKNGSDLRKSAWAHKHLVLGALAIFLYVGAEVAIGSFLINYITDFLYPHNETVTILNLYEIKINVENAGKLLMIYWGGAMIGRFIGAAIQKYISPAKILSFNAVMAAVLVIISMLTVGQIALWSILLVGLFNSIMFPTIFTLAIDGLGKHIGQGSGILCMAIIGGAIIPLIQGKIADGIGIHPAFILPVICYAYITFYGIVINRIK